MSKTVSLAKANRFRNLLKSKILPTLEQSIFESRGLSIVGYETIDEIKARANDTVTNFQNALDKRASVVNAIASLRTIIAAANFNFGVDVIMAFIKTHQDELKFLKSLVNDAGKSVDDIAKLVEYERSNMAAANALSTTYRTSYQTKDFIVSSDDNKSSILSNIAELDRNIRNLEENRNAVNYSKTVTLDDKIVEVLEAFKII